MDNVFPLVRLRCTYATKDDFHQIYQECLIIDIRVIFSCYHGNMFKQHIPYHLSFLIFVLVSFTFIPQAANEHLV